MAASCRFAMAVHLLAVLAHKGESVTSDAIASSVNTNPVVIRRLISALRAAGLVESQKGAGLGSRLTRLPRRISLAEIYRAVETPESFAFPEAKPNRRCPVGSNIQLALESVFSSAQKAMERELQRRTLADILRAVGKRAGRPG